MKVFAQVSKNVAQIGCGVAQIVGRPLAVRHELGLDFRPGTPLEIPQLTVSGEDTA